jgi:hypothetical protein
MTAKPTRPPLDSPAGLAQEVRGNCTGPNTSPVLVPRLLPSSFVRSTRRRKKAAQALFSRESAQRRLFRPASGPVKRQCNNLVSPRCPGTVKAKIKLPQIANLDSPGRRLGYWPSPFSASIGSVKALALSFPRSRPLWPRVFAAVECCKKRSRMPAARTYPANSPPPPQLAPGQVAVHQALT